VISSVEYILRTPEMSKGNFNWGSIFHGLLFELIDQRYTNELHEGSIKPFSQFLYRNKETGDTVWRVNGLNEFAYIEIIKKLEEFDSKSFYLRQKKIEIEIVKKNIYEPFTYKQFCDEIFIENKYESQLKLDIITPCAFKQKESYTYLPDLRLIYSSLLSKWNVFAEVFSLDYDEGFDHIVNYSKILKYSLSSTTFHLEGIRIPAFKGWMCISIKGPNELKKIANLLIRYSNYTGIGIKTAIGMGGVRVQYSNKSFKE
jgi:CRISPR-associated endoribonuclease Cas6